jgi:uncharacterized protein (DUF39 family)
MSWSDYEQWQKARDISASLEPRKTTQYIGCESKTAHLSFEAAKREAKRIGQQVYRCKFCREWHVGHASTRRGLRL